MWQGSKLSPSCRNRILREAQQFEKRNEKERAEVLSFDRSQDNPDAWICRFVGPEGTHLSECVFEIRIEYTPDYPMTPPAVSFKPSTVFHPNVDFDEGNVCLSVLERGKWSCATTILSLIQTLRSFLVDPYPASSLNADASFMYLNDREAYEAEMVSHLEKFLVE